MLHSIYTVFLSEMACSSSDSSHPSSPILSIPPNMKVKLKLLDSKYQADITSKALWAVTSEKLTRSANKQKHNFKQSGMWHQTF